MNTFLVDHDFLTSARKLDKRRLGKQRVEAYQILTILQNLHMLATILQISAFPIQDVTKTKAQRDEWIHYVLAKFKSTGIKAIHICIESQTVRYYYNKEEYPIRPTSEEELNYQDGVVTHFRRLKRSIKLLNSGPRERFVFPDDYFITSGWVMNPAVSMWLGFEETLKLYINAHIQAWKERGYRNTMSTYNLVSCSTHPAWIGEDIFTNFKSTLIEREIERSEAGWYIYQYDFICAWITDLQKREEFCKLMNYSLANNLDWRTVYKKEQLLTYGKFPGFIWP